LYKQLIRPLLFRLDAEAAHHMVSGALEHLGGMPFARTIAAPYRSASLQTNLFGTTVANPIGLAAGFDKNGKLVSVLGNLGFGFAEIGSVTALACAGNPSPRLFRLPEDEALVNRLGLNGEGADAVATRLLKAKFSLPIGINIAKTNHPDIVGDRAVADVVESFETVRNLPVMYAAFNASCPNTHDGCIQEREELRRIFFEVQALNNQAKKLPILVKVSPDSSAQLLDDIVDVAIEFGLAGFICGNTTTTRSGLATNSTQVEATGKGGLSGKPLHSMAVTACRSINKRKLASQQIIGVGGVRSAGDIVDFYEAGASAVQIYTALVYEGPRIVGKMARELESMGKKGPRPTGFPTSVLESNRWSDAKNSP
jgi:dihydroorotate dehydrogenase